MKVTEPREPKISKANASADSNGDVREPRTSTPDLWDSEGDTGSSNYQAATGNGCKTAEGILHMLSDLVCVSTCTVTEFLGEQTKQAVHATTTQAVGYRKAKHI